MTVTIIWFGFVQMKFSCNSIRLEGYTIFIFYSFDKDIIGRNVVFYRKQ